MFKPTEADALVSQTSEVGFILVAQWGIRPPTGLIEAAAEWLRTSYTLSGADSDPELAIELTTLTRVIEALVDAQCARERSSDDEG